MVQVQPIPTAAGTDVDEFFALLATLLDISDNQLPLVGFSELGLVAFFVGWT